MEEKFVITEINRVILVGKDEYMENITSFSHRVKHNELIFHFSGHATVYFDDLMLDTRPNMIRFLPKGETKRYDVVRHEPGECIDVFFETDRPVSSEAFVQNASQNEKIASLFKKLFATWMGKNEGYYFDSIALLYQIFSEMQKDTRLPKAHADKIAPALEAIHNGFLKTNFSLKELASECKMGESYFQKLFKAVYGTSPKKYIIQMKIDHACDLLALGCYSVTRVSQLCNFSDVYFFSRQFKEYMGITPTAFAKKYKSSK